jgi:hypothetical protein
MEDWLAQNLPEGGRVGVDPFCHTVDSVRRLQKKLTVSCKTAKQLHCAKPTGRPELEVYR